MSVVVDGCHDARIVGSLHGERGPAVKGFASRQHTLAPRVERGELQGIFVGLGSGVDEKELIVGITAEAAQTFGELFLQTVDHGVGIEAQRLQLLLEFLHVVRMAVTDADDGMPAVEVEIFLSFVVPHMATLAFDDVDVEKRIYGK